MRSIASDLTSTSVVVAREQKKKKRKTSVTVITRRRSRDGSVHSTKTKMQGTIKDAMELISKQKEQDNKRIENVHLNIT